MSSFEQSALLALEDEVRSDGDFWASTSRLPFPEEAITDAAFRYFRQAGFPYRRLPQHVCMAEINRLALLPMDQLRTSLGALHVADSYHPHRFHGSGEGMASPYEAFHDDKKLRRALALEIAHSGAVGTGVFGTLSMVQGVQACANFRPGFACYLYRRFCGPGDTVLDACTGYGGRLVGFFASGIGGKYIGIDPSTRTHEGNMTMAEQLGFASAVELYNKPAEDMPIELVEGRCDFAFTSPPYFSREIYADEPTQSRSRYKTVEEWRDGFLYPFMRLQFSALKAGAHCAVNVADVKANGKHIPLVNMTMQAAREAGFMFLETEAMPMRGRRYGSGKDGLHAEPLLIFRRPA